jgi:hypothetical protein
VGAGLQGTAIAHDLARQPGEQFLAELRARALAVLEREETEP